MKKGLVLGFLAVVLLGGGALLLVVGLGAAGAGAWVMMAGGTDVAIVVDDVTVSSAIPAPTPIVVAATPVAEPDPAVVAAADVAAQPDPAAPAGTAAPA